MSIYFIAAKPLFDLGNLWALDIRYIQYVTYQKKNFVTFKLYASDPITGIGRIQIQSTGQKTVKLACNIQKH